MLTIEKIYDATTGEEITIEREMTEKELADYQAAIAAAEAAQAEAEAQAAARAAAEAKLEALGLTADDLKALGL